MKATYRTLLLDRHNELIEVTTSLWFVGRMYSSSISFPDHLEWATENIMATRPPFAEHNSVVSGLERARRARQLSFSYILE
ncbi:MAG: hypothetical protein HY513_02730 [Candidatus Aenigmarchaeota archaeon]|nr:hypothetical protein [Candidatus Aenigmarchaeota archaeon]